MTCENSILGVPTAYALAAFAICVFGMQAPNPACGGTFIALFRHCIIDQLSDPMH